MGIFRQPLRGFHRNIKQIGATGGGAHKFASEWERGLGITMAKQSEMDSLVAGMQFVMQDIVGDLSQVKNINLGTELEYLFIPLFQCGYNVSGCIFITLCSKLLKHSNIGFFFSC